jgi:hypothetical protein
MLAERALPFFKLLRKSGPFVWIEEAEETFQELKRYLTSPPIMVAPKPGEPLLLYISATAEVMSMVLVIKCPAPHQPQEPKGASVGGSRSHDPEPTQEARIKEAVGSQLPENSPAPESQVGSQPPEPTPGPEGHTTTGSQLLKAMLGLNDQEATRSQLPGAVLGLGGQELLGPEPM